MEILVNSATCCINSNIIFENANISLTNSEICIIMGPNGCGKTTFIKCLCNIQNLEHGQVLIDSIDLRDADSNYLDNILYIGHKNSLNNDLTVKENLEYLSALDSTANNNEVNKINDAMEYFDLCRYRDFMVSTLSEGNKKKTSLARLIMSSKKIWLLDEPLSSLDEISTKNLINLFSEHQKKGGIIITSSHYDFSESVENFKLFRMEN
ncbi:MAG: heme ABC exporter ATP-binding protein CcmA [Gammaproteobacteria bacterium]|nr:heme ABC exporter ATP-binding protein CcmA [Gammaproteobacteria bacterium]